MLTLSVLSLLACKGDPEPVSPPAATPAPTPVASLPETCGDAVLDPSSEACDDGVNDGSYGGCEPGCASLGPRCGDGDVQAVEVCDNGDNFGLYGGCMPGCGALAPRCGDGTVDFEEACDDGANDGSYDGCSSNCLEVTGLCGDGVVEGPEACDDGVNDGSYGGCATDCLAVTGQCGDGVVEGPEVCDDGVNDGTYDGCASDCGALGAHCGDGTVDTVEVCDDGLNDGSYDGCASDCQTRGGFCGDGVVDAEEACDDGVNDWLDGGCQPGCEAEDRSEGVYDLNRFLDVAITMDPAAWETLRSTKRSRHGFYGGEDCLDQPLGRNNPHVWHEGEVRIDGTVVGVAGVKKKGLLGTQTSEKPSMKIDFSRVDEDLRFEGLKRLIFNNDVADPSHLHQCLTYLSFREAGLPAARCNFARVTVNGEDLGIYSHIEPMKKSMLRYHLGNADGNLYEGTVSDFHPMYANTFEQDLNEADDPSRDDLAALTDVLETVSDDDLLAALEPLVDLDFFFRFWAMEVLSGHHDSYTGNGNNFYAYADPARDGRFVFLPWGTDHAFHVSTNLTLLPETGRIRTILAHRLYTHPEGQVRFFEALDSHLENHWDVAALTDAVDAHLAVLLANASVDEASGLEDQAQIVRDFIATRDAVLRVEWENGAPEKTFDLRPNPCLVEVGVAQLTMTDSMWDETALGAWEDCPTDRFNVTVDGGPLTGDTPLVCRAGIHTNDRHYVQSYTVDSATNVRYTATMLLPASGDFPDEGEPTPITGDWIAQVSAYDLTDRVSVGFWYIPEGTIVLHEYSLVHEEPVSVSIAGTMWRNVAP